MNFAERNKKVALARWNRIHQNEAERLKSIKNADVLRSILCGFLSGDGSVQIRSEKRNKAIHHQVDFFPDDKTMLEKYNETIFELYGKTPSVVVRDNVFNARISSKTIVLDLHRFARFGVKKWCPPAKLLKNKESKAVWLKAFFSAEAYVNNKGTIKVQTVNKKGMQEVSNLLSELGIEHRNYKYTPKRKNHSVTYIVVITKKEAKRRFCDEIGFWHSKKTKRLTEALAL